MPWPGPRAFVGTLPVRCPPCEPRSRSVSVLPCTDRLVVFLPIDPCTTTMCYRIGRAEVPGKRRSGSARSCLHDFTLVNTRVCADPWNADRFPGTHPKPFIAVLTALIYTSSTPMATKYSPPIALLSMDLDEPIRSASKSARTEMTIGPPAPGSAKTARMHVHR